MMEEEWEGIIGSTLISIVFLPAGSRRAFEKSTAFKNNRWMWLQHDSRAAACTRQLRDRSGVAILDIFPSGFLLFHRGPRTFHPLS